MPYKRPNIDRPKKPHPIQEDFKIYDQIHTEHDPGWITPHLVELHDDACYALHGFSRVIAEVTARDYSEYKEEIERAKRAEPILQAKRALLSFLRKHIAKAKSDVEAMKDAILRETQPPTISDPTRAMLQELKNQEIRTLIRNADPRHRHDMVAGNLAYIQALIDAPDDILNKEHLTEIRRAFAFHADPTLAEQEKDTQEIYRAVRKRAGDINATTAKMLILSKIDDPLPPAEHYQAFPPESDYEKVLAEKRVQRWDGLAMDAERKKEIAEKQADKDHEAGERVTRITRGIQH